MRVLLCEGQDFRFGPFCQNSPVHLALERELLAVLNQNRTVRIMCPDTETPLLAADEVGVIVADPQVIDGGDFVQVGDGLNADPSPVVC